ncbi:hypothetical protein DYB30_013145, partial [Aphanomyces astaci]
VTCTRTVAKSVLAFLQEHNIVSVIPSCTMSYGSCLRAVQSYLDKEGYARGKHSGSTEYRMTKAHEEARDAYVSMMEPTKNGKIVKDYHAVFNHEYFVDWFGKLIDEGEELGWASAVFVMDNAKYHKGKPK